MMDVMAAVRSVQGELRDGVRAWIARRRRAAWAVVAGLALLVSAAPVAAAARPVTPPLPRVYFGFWQGRAVQLTHVVNVTVEGLGDAKLTGRQLTAFATDNPRYACLDGHSLNVFTAPGEFPNDFVVHNGLQGPQCVYGTWLIPMPEPSYTALLRGRRVALTHVVNRTVEALPDQKRIGMVRRFQTNDPRYACLNGENINLFVAPHEYPNDLIVHNGLQGSQCTYGTWLIPEGLVLLSADGVSVSPPSGTGAGVTAGAPGHPHGG